MIGADVAGEAVRGRDPGLGHEHPRVGVRVGDAPPLAIHLVHGIAVPERVVRLRLVPRSVRPLAEIGQVLVLVEPVGDVDPEAVDPAVEPEAQHPFEFGVDVRFRPVQVRLPGVEEVQVPLARPPVGLADARPGGPTEDALPVVRRLRAIATSGSEQEALPLMGSRSRRERGPKPRMLARQVVRHDVEQHAQVQRSRLGDERLGLRQRPEQRVDGTVVGDVVAGIGHR